MPQALALFLTSVQLFLGRGESWPEKALLPGGVRGEAAGPETVWGGCFLSPGDLPQPEGRGKRPQEVSKERPRGGFFPPCLPRILFLCRNCQPPAFCQTRSVYSYFRLFALCVISTSALFSKYFTASGPL